MISRDGWTGSISWLTHGDHGSVLHHMLLDKVTIHFDVLCPFMEHGLLTIWVALELLAKRGVGLRGRLQICTEDDEAK